CRVGIGGPLLPPDSLQRSIRPPLDLKEEGTACRDCGAKPAEHGSDVALPRGRVEKDSRRFVDGLQDGIMSVRGACGNTRPGQHPGGLHRRNLPMMGSSVNSRLTAYGRGRL